MGNAAAGTAGPIWYVIAAVSYCAASIVEKGLLNWFVGPLWLVAVVWLGPELVDLVRARSSRRGRGRGRVRQ
jgi:hypothetical protein